MSKEIEGPHPEKRLTDLVQLAAAFVPALEAYEAKRYPDQQAEDGAYDGIAEACISTRRKSLIVAIRVINL